MMVISYGGSLPGEFSPSPEPLSVAQSCLRFTRFINNCGCFPSPFILFLALAAAELMIVGGTGGMPPEPQQKNKVKVKIPFA